LKLQWSDRNFEKNKKTKKKEAKESISDWAN
jgi:hypothetical protein